jgi:hypothetical protein
MHAVIDAVPTCLHDMVLKELYLFLYQDYFYSDGSKEGRKEELINVSEL